MFCSQAKVWVNLDKNYFLILDVYE